MTIHHQDANVTLHHGDCLDVLRTLPDASVDSVVTDPPYGLEFMGKEWDKFVPENRRNREWDSRRRDGSAADFADSVRDRGDGRPGGPSFSNAAHYKPNSKCNTCGLWQFDKNRCRCEVPDFAYRIRHEAPTQVLGFQQWCELWAAECLRVLRPGGHLLAFGGTRTWHRLACAVEDAGFEVRDSLAWLYGCLTSDAEVLTDRGWVNGLDVREGDLVAQWDHETGRVELAPVERTFRAPWDGPMRVLRSSDTDQVLTPNHRVYHRTYEREQVAGVRRGSWSEWKVAEAGDLGTWQATRLPIAGTHDGPGVGGEDYAALLGWVWTEGGFDQSGTGVRIYQSSVNADKCDEIAALLDRMGPHKRYDYARTYTRRNGEAHPHISSTWFFSGELANRVRADLPGKRPTYDLLWRMTADEKRALLRAAMLGDGSGWGGKCPQFYQKHEDDLVWLQTLLALIDQAGKVTMRPDREGGQVSLRKRGTTDLQARHLRDSTEDYTGEVWCVKVHSGAFLARRNGKVFVTGNSGFPKSLDVSKAIDKAAGAERTEVVGTRGLARWKDGAPAGVAMKDDGGIRQNFDKVNTLHAPATDAAREWAGFGTALKPAFEPVVVARKPLIGTVAANVQEHGTGALNIDATRIGMGDEKPPTGSGVTIDSVARAGGSMRGVGGNVTPPSGRWPANVILDEDMAGVLDQQSGTSLSQGGSRGAGGQHGAYSPIPAQPDVKPGYGDTGGASRFFYVAKAPKRERPVVDGVAHPTVKPLALMRWLVRLVTPPGGTVLEPFAGSGTTVEACLLEGFQCVAIEKGDEYLPLILARIHRQAEPVPEAAELVRTTDPAEAILEQIDGQLDIFGEGVA